MKHERRATWLELFFDLIFVGAVAIYAHSLEEHFTLIIFIKSIPIFIAIWGIWVNYAAYYDLHDAGLWGNWFSTLTSSFIMLFFIATIPRAIEGDITLFVFWIGITRINLGLLNIFRYLLYKDEYNIVLLIQGLVYILFSVLYFLLITYVSPQYLYTGFVIIFIADFLSPLITISQIYKFFGEFYEWCEQQIKKNKLLHKLRKEPAVQAVNHIQERHGLFILIAIGENITTAANVINKLPFSGTLFIETFMVFGTVYWMMLMFYSRIREGFYNYVIKNTRFNLAMTAGYLHLGIAFSITMYSMGILMLLTEHNTLIGYYVTYSSVIGFFMIVTLLQNLWRPLSTQVISLRGITCLLLVLWMIVKPDLLWATIALYFSVWLSPLVSIIQRTHQRLFQHKKK